MTSPVSSEFAAFCQGQLRLLVQSTGASLGAVYIAEEWLGGDDSSWVPVASYPEHAAAPLGRALLAPAMESASLESWGEQAQAAAVEYSEGTSGREGAGVSLAAANRDLPVMEAIASGIPSSGTPNPGGMPEAAVPGRAGGVGRFLAARLRRWQQVMEKGSQQDFSAVPMNPGTDWDQPADWEESDWEESGWEESDWEVDSGEPRAGLLHQAMQPLLCDGQPVGMLIAVQEHRDWQRDDRRQLKSIALTLSTACTMERRLQWLQTRVHQQEIAQEKQQDIIDNLLHQFRNPLTALRTFGKLLVRRLSPEDRNRAVAAGIVRESDRLQGLLSQIGETVDSFALPEAVVGEIVTESPPERPRLLLGQAQEEESAQEEAKPETGLASPSEPLALPAARQEPGTAKVSPLTGKPLVLAAHCVADLIDDRLPSWEAVAQLREQQVIISLDAPQTQVWADQAALGEVLSNLVDNALKYGLEGGTVAVSVRTHPAGVRPGKMAASPDANLPHGGLSEAAVHEGLAWEAPGNNSALRHRGAWQCIAISDDGPGIPGTDLPRLFERHYRGVQAAGSKPGTGLGLAIARSLVNQMEGELLVQSPAETWHPRVLLQRSPGIAETALNPAAAPGSVFFVWLRVLELPQAAPSQ